MAWFNYYTSGALTTSVTPPVRRLIVFPFLTDNLKIGDWIGIDLENYNIGQVFSYSSGSVVQSFDQDSFVVVYETANTKTVTYSGVDSDNVLYFKSVTDVNKGLKPQGSYYLYYHSDNVQYIQLSGSNYVSTLNSGQTNYIASTSASGNNNLNYYSHLVQKEPLNIRDTRIGYFGDPSIWTDGQSNSPGSKVVGSFSGPRIKIYGDKGPDKGKVKIKITKTTPSANGQSIVKEENNIDLYSQTEKLNTNIYTFNALDIITLTKEEQYSNYSFEIELLQEKNPLSSKSSLNITSYAFNKNYGLVLNAEEIDSTIAFISTGAIR